MTRAEQELLILILLGALVLGFLAYTYFDPEGVDSLLGRETDTSQTEVGPRDTSSSGEASDTETGRVPSIGPARGPPALTAAVVGFANLSGTRIEQGGEAAAEILSTLMVQTGVFSVVERARVAALVQEMGFVYSGLADQESAALQIGNLLGADVIGLGSILDYGVSRFGYAESGITMYSMQISIKLVEVNTGRVLYADLIDERLRILELGGLEVTRQNTERTLLTNILRRFVVGLQDADVLMPGDAGPHMVSVEVNSNPSGASVEVNEIYVGSTPMTYLLEEDAIYEIRITYPGMRPWEMRMKAYDGLVVNAILAPTPATEEDER